MAWGRLQCPRQPAPSEGRAPRHTAGVATVQAARRARRRRPRRPRRWPAGRGSRYVARAQAVSRSSSYSARTHATARRLQCASAGSASIVPGRRRAPGRIGAAGRPGSNRRASSAAWARPCPRPGRRCRWSTSVGEPVIATAEPGGGRRDASLLGRKRSARRMKLPRDLDIFSPPIVTQPLCTQWRANSFPSATAPGGSFSWWGRVIESWPPPCSKPSPRRPRDITTALGVANLGRPDPDKARPNSALRRLGHAEHEVERGPFGSSSASIPCSGPQRRRGAGRATARSRAMSSTGSADTGRRSRRRPRGRRDRTPGAIIRST